MSTLSKMSSLYDGDGQHKDCLDLSPLSITGINRVLTVWLARSRQRRALSALDERLLKDIGLTPAQAREESTKPFWQG